MHPEDLLDPIFGTLPNPTFPLSKYQNQDNSRLLSLAVQYNCLVNHEKLSPSDHKRLELLSILSFPLLKVWKIILLS